MNEFEMGFNAVLKIKACAKPVLLKKIQSCKTNLVGNDHPLHEYNAQSPCLHPKVIELDQVI